MGTFTLQLSNNSISLFLMFFLLNVLIFLEYKECENKLYKNHKRNFGFNDGCKKKDWLIGIVDPSTILQLIH